MSQMKLPARDYFSKSYLLDVREMIRSKKLILQTITSINLAIHIKTYYLGLSAQLVFMKFRSLNGYGTSIVKFQLIHMVGKSL